MNPADQALGIAKRQTGHLLKLNQQKKSRRKEELIERCVDGQLNGQCHIVIRCDFIRFLRVLMELPFYVISALALIL